MNRKTHQNSGTNGNLRLTGKGANGGNVEVVNSTDLDNPIWELSWQEMDQDILKMVSYSPINTTIVRSPYCRDWNYDFKINDRLKAFGANLEIKNDGCVTLRTINTQSTAYGNFQNNSFISKVQIML